MTTVRPPFPQGLPPGAAPAGQVRTAAQRAFFEAALGKASAAQPAAAPERPAPAPAPAAAAASEPPKKILRPGSLLDIRV